MPGKIIAEIAIIPAKKTYIPIVKENSLTVVSSSESNELLVSTSVFVEAKVLEASVSWLFVVIVLLVCVFKVVIALFETGLK